MKDWEAELDEDGIFAYGRDVATRWTVRFKTTAQMLRFVRRPEMEWEIKQSDDKIIYINRDIVKPIEEITRDRQINKLIRVIIEFENNTDGETTRKLITARRKRGTVEYKGVKVGQIIDGKMVLLGDVIKFQVKFDELMNQYDKESRAAIKIREYYFLLNGEANDRAIDFN